ncbi:response regulator transcription factor [Naasia lichenicola]|uniref:Response regulator transcription factor n=1 Tax=Naasia lichenicola TaxID=2565933 RepID=A0A4S4FQJ7_9MICO|nr:response regulator transcription factor [Naasia lichenicola]THG32839.1 response regulator transcription factor [Naasia lichenicola]
MRVLVVEDDDAIARSIVQALREASYAVDREADAAAALYAFEIDEPDLVVLDLRLPGLRGGGFELCQRIREISASVPVIMLTAIDSHTSKVRGLDAGADDYLTKPFHIDELLARVRALLRRSPIAQPPMLRAADLVLDPATRSVQRDGRRIELTAKEFAVLDYLVRNQGRIVSSSELIDHAWDSAYEGYSNVVPTYVRYLRRKLAVPGRSDPITTHRGSGYSIAASH